MPDSSPGLCAFCLHAEPIRSARGSTFLRCRLHFTDPRYPKYPSLPVLQCSGFRPAEPDPVRK